MEIKNFEELPITTMTLVIKLNSDIIKELAFHLLPITKIEIQQTREASKCKLPHCDIPGSIISLRYKDMVRGVIKSKSKPFKNAVTIDISTIKKNISLKLSANTIQMCGASSKDNGVEAAKYLINHLKRIQKIIKKIQENKEETKKIVEWVKEESRGDIIEKNNWDKKEYDNVTLLIKRENFDYKIKTPINIPSNFDNEVTSFFISMIHDFIYHSDMCSKLDFIMNIKKIIEDDLEILNINEAMVNYNYSLGFKVDRTKVNKYIDGKHGFISRYNNAFATSVTIELPYDPILKNNNNRRKNKIPHHTFLVYRSGSVTQSGPGGTSMKDAYYLFMNTINDIKDLIIYTND